MSLSLTIVCSCDYQTSSTVLEYRYFRGVPTIPLLPPSTARTVLDHPCPLHHAERSRNLVVCIMSPEKVSSIALTHTTNVNLAQIH